MTGHALRHLQTKAQGRFQTFSEWKQGPLIVARDIAHAKISERFDQTGVLPEYVKDSCLPGASKGRHVQHSVQDHPIYYAGPAKPEAKTQDHSPWNVESLPWAEDACRICLWVFRTNNSGPFQAEGARLYEQSGLERAFCDRMSDLPKAWTLMFLCGNRMGLLWPAPQPASCISR